MEVSFQDEVGTFEGTTEISVGPGDQTAIALAAEDSLDDICDQIRMLRSAVLPAELPRSKEWLPDPGRQASTPERADRLGHFRGASSSMALSTAPALSSPASQPGRFLGQRTMSTTSTSYTAQGASPLRHNALMDKAMEQAVAVRASPSQQRHRSEPQASAQSDPLQHTRRVISPLRLRPTLWEERQLEQCFRRWRMLPSARGNSRAPATQVELAFPAADAAVCENRNRFAADAVPATQDATCRRRDLCFRVWHRICAARRAEELALSLRLLDSQVAQQLRRGVARWWTWSQASMGRKVIKKHRVFRRRFNLRRWHQLAGESRERRVVRDQVAALLRKWFLRHSTRLWARRAAEMARSKRADGRLVNSLLRTAFYAWRCLPDCLREYARQASANARLLLVKTKRRALRRWLETARHNTQHRSLASRGHRTLMDFSRRIALQRWIRHTQRRRRLSRTHGVASVQVRHRCQAAAIADWSRWSYRRLQSRRVYQGHVATRVLPRTMRAMFELWISVVRREQRYQAALQRAMIVMALSLKGRTFHSWHGVRQCRKKAMKVIMSLMTSPISVFFRCWFNAMSTLQQERRLTLTAETHRGRRVSRWLFGQFCIGVAASKADFHKETRAQANASRFLALRTLELWRANISVERWERHQIGRALNHNVLRLALVNFAIWRRNAASDRLDRHHHKIASSQQQSRSVRIAWISWCRFAAFKRKAKALECAELTRSFRRRHHFQHWARVFATMQRQRHVANLRYMGAVRAFFGWGALMRQRRQWAREVMVLQQTRRLAESMSRMKGLWRSRHHCRSSTGCRLLRDAWQIWTTYIQDHRGEIERKTGFAETHRDLFLLSKGLLAMRFAVLSTAAMQRHMLRLAGALEPLVDLLHHRSKRWSMDNWFEWVDQCRAIDEAELELAYLELRQLCFQYWARYCQHIGHKRMVIELCDSHRFGRLLRRSFEGWVSTQLNWAELDQAVYYMAEGNVRQRALELFEFWRSLTACRRRCRSLQTEFVSRRQEKVLMIWLGCLRKRQEAWHILQRGLHQRLVTSFLAWRDAATASIVRKRQSNVLMEEVRRVRQRRWIEQWRAVGRWNRLTSVAVSWDHTTFSGRWLFAAFRAWAETLALFARGEEVSRRVQAVRTRTHLRAWGKLARMLEVRPRVLSAQTMRDWVDAVARSKVEMRATNAINRMRAIEALRRMRKFYIDHKHHRQHFDDRSSSTLNSIRRSRWRSAVATWSKWARPRAVLRKAHADGRLVGAHDQASKFHQLQALRRQRVFGAWQQAWRDHGAKTKTPAPHELEEHQAAVVHQPDSPAPPVRPAGPPQPPPKPMLRITVVSAKNLRDSDWTGKSDPFVICEVPEHPNTKVQTKVINNDLNPHWNEGFDIHNYEIGQPLAFTVMDKDVWPKPDDFLGRTHLTCDDFYPHGFAGGLHLQDDGGANSTLWVKVEVFNAPHLRIRRVAPTVARSLVPINPASVFAAWAASVRKRRGAASLQAMIQNRMKQNLRTRTFHRWADLYDHHAASKFANGMLDRMRASRIMHGWSKFASFHKRFHVHVAHVQVLKDTQCMRTCFERWHTSLREHYQVASMWLERWRHWSSALLLAWRGFVRERKKMRRSLLKFRRGVLFLQKCRKADLMVLCKLSALLRASFDGYARWIRKTVLIRERCNHVGNRVADGRQRRRLCCWAACGRSVAQDADASRAFAEMLGLPAPSFLEGQQHMLNASGGAAYVKNITFALWAELTSSMRPYRRVTRSLSMRAACRLKWNSVNTWRLWTQMIRYHRQAVGCHRARWEMYAARPYIVEWRRIAHHALAAFQVLSSRDLRLMRALWRGWLSVGELSKQKVRCAVAFRNLHQAQARREIVWSWAEFAGKDARVRKLAHRLESIHSRWATEEEWRQKAASDSSLRTMFCRFATAFDGRLAQGASNALINGAPSTPAHGPRPLPRAETFEAVLKLIWSRQQLTVALARLRGEQCQQWALGLWPVGLSPLVPRDSAYYALVERRLPLMIARVEDEALPARALAIVQEAKHKRREERQPWSMWPMLADVLVVHHPGLPSGSRQPIGSMAQHHQVSSQQGQQLPFHSYNIAADAASAGRPLPDSTPHFGLSASFGIPALGSSARTSGVVYRTGAPPALADLAASNQASFGGPPLRCDRDLAGPVLAAA